MNRECTLYTPFFELTTKTLHSLTIPQSIDTWRSEQSSRSLHKSNLLPIQLITQGEIRINGSCEILYNSLANRTEDWKVREKLDQERLGELYSWMTEFVGD